ncbi:hypothetical protein ACIBQX_18965 [Nonomuraea sp. NPDC049714]|uniref:hypothetical protein n=1 Tax=Nonomuraea sp. NPDC049714 TaxID=3364357 RepID=UPI003788B48C
MSRPRTTCPVCGRNIVKRKNGSPVSHYPPPGRSDLACGDDPRAHCRGSHPQETARPSVRGGAQLTPNDEDTYREEQNDRD